MFFSFSKNDEGQTADDKKASENNASLISEENSTKRGINTPYWTEEKSTVISKKRKIDKHEQGISTGGQSHYKKEHEVSETPLPYIGMIAEAIFSNPNKKMVLAEIYAYMERNFFHYLSSRPRWRNTVRHNLSFHNCFVKCECSRRGNRSHFWCVHPDYVEQFKRGNFTKTLSPPREQISTQNVQGAYHRYYERDYSRECLQETQHEYSPSSFNAIPIIRFPHTFSGHMTTPTATNAVFQSHHTLNSYQAMQTSSTRGKRYETFKSIIKIM